jgi:lantibiotic biosynthesis protein
MRPEPAVRVAPARPVSSTWAPQLAPSEAERAVEAARMIAERVTDTSRVRAAVASARGQTRFPLSVHWDPASLAQGDTGQAVLCAQLDRCFPDEGWQRIGHAHLARAVAAVQERGGAAPSIFSGLAGVAFAARVLGRGSHYRRLLGVVDAEVSAGCLSQVAGLGRDGVPVSMFDLISGLSGVTAYLLSAGDGTPAHPALPHALHALARLAADGPVPAWHTPVHLLHDEDQARQFPLGNVNCGLAHGIPGPLAVMSLAVADGFEREELSAAVRELAYWLASHRCDDAAGPNWPTVVPLTDEGTGLRLGPVSDRSRSAWCYGSPGIARALWLAGVALSDEDLQRLAMQAMEAVYRRPVPDRAIDSPTVCHGVAGLLQITLRFAHDTRLPVFRDAAAELTRQILGCVDPQRPMGVANVEPAGNLVDQPGLLDGATGAALVLLAAGTAEEPVWDRVLALS